MQIIPSPFPHALGKSLTDTPFKKSLRTTTHYVWRTQGDSHVRASHAANNGKIFAWDSPPPTGHPGEEYGCRCMAMTLDSENGEGIQQFVTSIIDNNLVQWSAVDFLDHFYFGNGRTVSLSEIGLLSGVIEKSQEAGHVFDRVADQVIAKAREVISGDISDYFINAYSYHSVSFPIGDATIIGFYTGKVTREEKLLFIEAQISYRFFDDFTDPLDIRDIILGGSSVLDIPEWLLYIRSLSDIQNDTNFYGQSYFIIGEWQTALRGVITL